MPGYIPHPPSPRQAEFLALDCREALYGGAAGGGKSDALLMAALQGVHVPGYSALLLRRTYADLSLPGALMDRAHSWLQGTGAEWSERDKRWAFPSGSSLGFGYLETRRDRYRYQGAELQFVGFDELTQFEQADYEYLFSRLRARSGIRVPLRMRAATNPGGIGHKWVQQRWQIPDAGCASAHDAGGRVFVPSLLADNPGLNQDEYRQSLAQLDSVTRDQLEHGRWVLDVSGLVYRYDPGQHSVDVLPVLDHGDEWHYVMGIDYGLRDACAWVVLAWSRYNPSAYLVYAESVEGMIPSEAARRTEELAALWQPEDIVGDPAAAGYIEESRRVFGLPIRAAQKTDKAGTIRLMNGALESGALRVVSGEQTAPWYDEASRLLWDDDRRLKENQSQPNHCCDAALYAWRETRAHLSAPRPDAPRPRPMDPYETQRINAANKRQERERWQHGLRLA